MSGQMRSQIGQETSDRFITVDELAVAKIVILSCSGKFFNLKSAHWYLFYFFSYMTKIIERNLFYGDNVCFELHDDTFSHKKKKKSMTTRELYKMDLFGDLQTVSPFEMPVIGSYNGIVPSRLVPFNVAVANHDYDCTAHFYINDPLFFRVLRNPTRYLSVLKKFKAVISPDFSQYIDFPYALRLCNAYWNRALAAWWQKNDVNVIFNVTWSMPDSYPYSFVGVPRHSTIAINCMGIKKHEMSQYLWMKGYEEAVKQLEPSCIIRYGSVMPGERTDISVYFENQIIGRMQHGR